MDFRLLGPLEVRDGGRPVAVVGPKQRALLAMLLLDADRVVPTARLLDALWDEPPESGAKALQMAVSGLRKALRGSRDVLETAPGGYRLRVDAESVDAHRFERLLSDARSALADNDAQRAVELLNESLGLWQGSALAEFASERFAAVEAARLEALREEAVEQRVEADLALGRHAELLPELESLVARHPLRERLRSQLMRALYRSGRQADALAVFHATRRALVEELGIEPGPELQRLQQAILRQDAALEAPAPAPARPDRAEREPADEPAVPLEERKLVTVLFADLAESTALGEQLDPERLRAVLTEYFEAMASVVHRWGGTVEKFIGDAVVAVFGVPAMREDDAERALAAALEMRERIEDLNLSLLDRHGIRLALKIGVNTGDVFAGGHTGHFIVTGDAVNAAARLEQAAAPGEILVGERTHHAARHAFELGESGEVTLKGKAGPVRSWRLLTARAAGDSGRPLTGRLVGRERELTLLETFLGAAVEEQRPQLVAITGSAGIGKSRLVQEFLSRSATAVHTGRCLSYGEGITYWALRDLVWSAAGILLDDPAPAAAEKVHSLVTGLPGLSEDEGERVLFALAVTAGGAVPGIPLEAVAPEAVRDELELGWPLFVSALAARSPLVLVIEDIHWAEPPLLDMLDRLLVRAVGPLLIVATSRPEGMELPSLRQRRPGAHQLSLEPLAAAQARELLAELLPDGRPALQETILGAGEGNPFFLEELARHVLESGLEPDDPMVIPDSVRALLAARIDALPPEQKLVLLDAAVVGRVFWTTSIETLRGTDPRAALRGLEDRGFVVTRPSSRLSGHPELAFRHALIREVAYQAIPRARRARAHAAAATWIETLAGDRREEFIELIAHHAASAAEPDDAALAWPDDATLRAGLRSKAVEALVSAGNAARARFAVEQAFGFADRALSLAAGDRERLSVVELKAETAHTAVRAQEAWSLYQEGLDLAERLGDRTAGARLAASATLLWSRFVGALPDNEWHQPAADIVTTWLERLGETAATFEVGALLVGRSLFDFDGIRPRAAEDALADARRAHAVAEAIPSPRLLSYAVDASTMLMGADGLCAAAEAGRWAAEARNRIVDRWTAHEMLINAAHLLASAGQLEEALAHAAEATREAADLSTHQRIHAAAAETYALVPLGRLSRLLEATASVPDLVEEEQKTMCYHGSVALAGHVLAEHEVRGRSRARRGLELLGETIAAGPDPVGERIRSIELLLRLRGVEESRALLLEQPAPSKRTAAIRHLRAALQIAALGRDDETVNELAQGARRLAEEACAPALGSIADWAGALVAQEWARAERSALALGRHGEAYFSARLLADLVPLVAPAERARLGEDAARRLDAVGARTSATEVRAAVSVS